MTKLLIKLFIKDSENIKDKNVRRKYGNLGGFVGIFSNLLLFALKLFAGIISGSIAITADAFNNLSDTGVEAYLRIVLLLCKSISIDTFIRFV